MKIAVFGLGYVGLSTAVWLCDNGHTVHGFDRNFELLEEILSGTSLPGEDEVPQRAQNYASGKNLILRTLRPGLLSHLHFDLVIIATYNSLDSHQIAGFDSIVDFARKNGITYDGLVIKSTINSLDQFIAFSQNHKVAVVPEFLRQGHAYEDVTKPTRVVIGSNDTALGDKLEELYQGCSRIFRVTNETAILAKLTANSILAMKVVVANEVAQIINRGNFAANSLDIAEIVGADPRIGDSHLRPGSGLGGACLPKDLNILGRISCEYSNSPIIHTISGMVEEMNIIDVMRGMANDRYHLVNHASSIVVVGAGFKIDSIDERGAPYTQIRNKNVLVYDKRLPEDSSPLNGYGSLDELAIALSTQAPKRTIVLINTTDLTAVSEVLDKITPLAVFDPNNYLSMEWYTLARGDTIPLFQNGIKA